MFESYRQALKTLITELDKAPPQIIEKAMTLQARLLENIESAETYGDPKTQKSERSEIVHALNHLSLQNLGKPFVPYSTASPDPVSDIDPSTQPSDAHKNPSSTLSKDDTFPPRFRSRWLWVLLIGVIIIPLLLLAPRLLRNSSDCPGQDSYGQSSHKIAVNLIDLESAAIAAKDMATIIEIFAPDAQIKDSGQGSSQPPYERYSDIFENYCYEELAHHNYTFKRTGNILEVTCTTTGYFGPLGNCKQYEIPNDLNIWRFQKDAQGCWRITEFIYNNYQSGE